MRGVFRIMLEPEINKVRRVSDSRKKCACMLMGSFASVEYQNIAGREKASRRQVG